MRPIAQLIALIWEFWWAIIRALVYLPYAMIYIASSRIIGRKHVPSGATFYCGIVDHSRKRPKVNTFSYPVRVAVVDLDSPPAWWSSSSTDNLTAAEARSIAGTNGPVKLLTNPTSAGYYQNPISVYYCYSYKTQETDDNKEEEELYLETCLSEVTNTPWGERVTFAFNPKGQQVPKALHVSPLMDMKNSWSIKASDPLTSDKTLTLSVAADHPELGPYFLATLKCTLDEDSPYKRNELASFKTLLQYGFQPHRIAFWIYIQAVILLYKGVMFYSPPDEGYKKMVMQEARHRPLADGRLFRWRDALQWPWREYQQTSSITDGKKKV